MQILKNRVDISQEENQTLAFFKFNLVKWITQNNYEISREIILH